HATLRYCPQRRRVALRPPGAAPPLPPPCSPFRLYTLPVTMIPLRLFLLAFVLTATGAVAAPAGLRAGAHAGDITPQTLPSPVNGSMRGNFAKSVSDPMHARALALQDGRGALILCVVDACMIPRELCEAAKAIAAKETGVPASQILI